MTDAEIIKALECCRQPVGSGACNNCPFDYQRKKQLEETDKSCTELMFGCVLDLINRQQAEIERLQKEAERFADLGKMYSEIKPEAYKEFAERLKGKEFEIPVDAYSVGYLLGAEDIDDILEEMG
jgi:hypothetical protein